MSNGSTNFPTSLDTNTVKVGGPLGDEITSTDHNDHSVQIEALEAKVGVDGSAVTTSHDYKLSGVTGTSKALSVLNGSISFNAPQGFLINGKISPTVSSNNLTVTILTADGSTPSSTKPVYCRIGNTVRSITGALSVTKNAGTNWFNAGSALFATKQIDYFVYLGYNATDGVVVGFSRLPHIKKYGDFSSTSTNERYAAISTITNAATDDNYENVGRFAAILSASSSYNWSVPSYNPTLLIQHPILFTRWLDWVPTLTVPSGTAPDYGATFQNKYRVLNNELSFACVWENTSNGTAGAGTNRIYALMPMANQQYVADRSQIGNGFFYESGGTIRTVYIWQDGVTGANNASFYSYDGTGILGNDQSSTARYASLKGSYEV